MKLVRFASDTKHRKQWFTGLSFSHPAKMSLPLQLWLIENFTKEGEIILDPMAGSGTLLVACSLGRNVVCVELEQKFVDMMKGNWAKIQQRGAQMGYEMGTAVITQGDARDLTGILADKIITSPPYASGGTKADENPENYIRREEERLKLFPNRPKTFVGRYSGDKANIGNLPYGQVEKIITSPPFQEAEIKRQGQEQSRENYSYGSKLKMSSEHPDNISKLAENSYGAIDAVISSPPYEEAMSEKHHSPRADKLAEEKSNPVTYTDKVDAVISSPPYEGSLQGEPSKERIEIRAKHFEETDIKGGRKKGSRHTPGRMRHLGIVGSGYSHSQENIGNLKTTSYLEAMLAVYQQCYAVLKPGGLMVLVTKNFIRNKQIIRLDLDTIKLCEQAGFVFQDRWYRELASQSFWRTIYYQKYPEVEPIKFEDVLVFGKEV